MPIAEQHDPGRSLPMERTSIRIAYENSRNESCLDAMLEKKQDAAYASKPGAGKLNHEGYVYL